MISSSKHNQGTKLGSHLSTAKGCYHPVVPCHKGSFVSSSNKSLTWSEIRLRTQHPKLSCAHLRQEPHTKKENKWRPAWQHSRFNCHLRHWRPTSECWCRAWLLCLQPSFPLLFPGRQQTMAQAFKPLPPLWETRRESQVPDFNLVQNL